MSLAHPHYRCSQRAQRSACCRVAAYGARGRSAGSTPLQAPRAATSPRVASGGGRHMQEAILYWYCTG